MFIIIILLVLLVIWEGTTFFVYGSFVEPHVTDHYMNLDTSTLRLNQYDPTILSTKQYIANVPFSLFVKYHIDKLGTVPRWSKLHKRIQEYFVIAFENSHKQ